MVKRVPDPMPEPVSVPARELLALVARALEAHGDLLGAAYVELALTKMSSDAPVDVPQSRPEA